MFRLFSLSVFYSQQQKMNTNNTQKIETKKKTNRRHHSLQIRQQKLVSAKQQSNQTELNYLKVPSLYRFHVFFGKHHSGFCCWGNQRCRWNFHLKEHLRITQETKPRRLQKLINTITMEFILSSFIQLYREKLQVNKRRNKRENQFELFTNAIKRFVLFFFTNQQSSGNQSGSLSGISNHCLN